MYTQFFRLTHPPFSIAPDPRYVYMSERHREALAHLLYGVNGGGGFVLLTGEIGAGKTTICRCFLEQVPENCNVAYIFNPKLSVIELLRTIREEFHIEALAHGGDATSAKEHVDALNRFLLAAHAAGRNNVLIIDEAQNLSADVLEQLRLLTNLETNERKLLQIILIGQPELRALLARPELEQLAQRVIARYHLDALTADETAGYIAHRLSVAGLVTAPPFRPRLTRTIHRITQGVPRRINLLCDRALLGAYAENRHEVDDRIVAKAAREVFGGGAAAAVQGAARRRLAWAALLAGGAAAAIAWGILNGMRIEATAERPPAVSALPERSAADRKPAAMPVAASMPPSVRAPQSGPRVAAMEAASLPAFDARDANAALRALAGLWNLALEDSAVPCEAAQANGLHCYTSAAGFAELRQLDRPAVLSLRDEAGQPYYGVLTGLSATEARLRIGDETRTLGIVALARQFDGSFTSLWRAPRDYRGRIAIGERGADVDWLARHLAQLNGGPAPTADAPYDRERARQVREFQFAQGLKVDGMVGPRTIMQLNRAAGIDEPRLQTIPATAQRK
ncbi:MAG TPA: AAA family ATPase [Paucimonas sp.]|nr:AAA family ATPase [Paucimonas sp.]